MDDSEQILDKILYHYASQRDFYYSDLEEGVISDDEWAAIRDKIQLEAKEAILQHYVSREGVLRNIKSMERANLEVHGRADCKSCNLAERLTVDLGLDDK